MLLYWTYVKMTGSHVQYANTMIDTFYFFLSAHIASASKKNIRDIIHSYTLVI